MVTRRSIQGFSLIEVMIAMAIIVIGLAGVTSAVWFGTHAGQHGTRISEATNHARSMLEALQGRNYLDQVLAGDMVGGWPGPTSGLNDAANTWVPLDDPPFLNAHLPQTDLRSYERNVVCTRMSLDDTDHEYTLAWVTIRIRWFEKGAEKEVSVTGVVSHALD